MTVTIDNLNTNILSIKSSKNSTWYSTAKVFNIQELVKDIVPQGMKLTQLKIKIVNTRTGTVNLNMTSGRIDRFKLQKETEEAISLELKLDDVNKVVELYAYEDVNASLPNNEFFEILDGTHIDLMISAQGYISNRIWYDTITNAFLTGVTYEEESSVIQASLEVGTTRKLSVDSIITNETDRRKVVGVVKKNTGLRIAIITFKNDVKLNRSIYKALCKYADAKRKTISNYVSKCAAYKESVIDLETIYRFGRKVTSIFNNALMVSRCVVNNKTFAKSALRKINIEDEIISQNKRKIINCAYKNNRIYRKTVSDNASINASKRKLALLKNNDFNTIRVNIKAGSKEAILNRNVGISDIVISKLRRVVITENSVSGLVHRIAVKDVNAINSTLRPTIVLSKNDKGTIRKNIANYKVNSAMKRTFILEYLNDYNSTRAIAIDKIINKKSIRGIAVNIFDKANMDRTVFADEIFKAITNRTVLANKYILRNTLRECIDGHLSIKTTRDAYGCTGDYYFTIEGNLASQKRYTLYNKEGALINTVYESELGKYGTADLDSTFSTQSYPCMIRYNLKRVGVAYSEFQSNFLQGINSLYGAFKNVVCVLPIKSSNDKAKFFVLRAIADTSKAEMIITDSYVEVDISKGTMKQSSVVTNEDALMKFSIPTTKAPTYKIVGYQRNEIILDFTGCNDFIVINIKTNVFKRMPRVDMRLDDTLCKSSNGYKQVSIGRPDSSTNIEVRFNGSGKVIVIDTGAINISVGKIMYDAFIDRYYFTQTVKVDDINYLKKYTLDIDQEKIISEEVLEERGRNSSQTEIKGLLGGGLGYPGNRYFYIPYLTDGDLDGKIHVLYRALLRRSPHIDSKPNFNIGRHITNSNSVTGDLNRKTHIADTVIKIVARKTLNDNSIKTVSKRSTILDLETYFNNYRVTLRGNLVLGPTARAVIDINVTIHQVDTLREVIAENINVKQLIRSSHVDIEGKLISKRGISTITSLNKYTKRSIGCSNLAYGYTHRNIIAGKEKSFNTERKSIVNYNIETDINRKVLIINNITGSTTRTVISHYDYTKTVPTSRTIVIGNISNYSTQRKAKSLIISDYKTLRVVTLRATDSKTYYFNAIVPIRIDKYPIYDYNMKINLINEYLAKVTMGMDFN